MFIINLYLFLFLLVYMVGLLLFPRVRTGAECVEKYEVANNGGKGLLFLVVLEAVGFFSAQK